MHLFLGALPRPRLETWSLFATIPNMSRGAWVLVVAVSLLTLLLFVGAALLDSVYGVNLLAALQGFGAFALLAVTVVYALTTRKLLDSQQSHYRGIAAQADRDARVRTFERMTPFASLMGEHSGIHRRLFADPEAQVRADAADKIFKVCDRMVTAAQKLLSTLPGLSGVNLENAQTFALHGTTSALVGKRLAILIIAEQQRASDAGSEFEFARVAEEWERPDEDAREYPRWADLRSGKYLEAAANAQNDIATAMAHGAA